MKNKFSILAASVLVTISLSACSNSQQGQSASSSSSTSSRSARVEKSNSSSSASSSSKVTSQAPKENRMDILTAKLHQVFPNMTLPTADGLGEGSNNLNVRYTKNGNKNVIYYSVGDRPVTFNSASLKNEKPYAILTEVTNANSSTASDMINYQAAQKGLPTVKLNDSITATTQGAAGQQYVQWNKGNYSFVVQASSQSNDDPVKGAKELLALVNKYQLPATSKNASVQVIMGSSEGSLNTIISWQDGNDVYQIQAHETETALKMLASLK